MAYPANYRYTREHEWIEVDGKTGTVGITDYAQNSLGDIVFVDAPKGGRDREEGRSLRQRRVGEGWFLLTCTRQSSGNGNGSGMKNWLFRTGKDQHGTAPGLDHEGWS